MHPTAPRQDAKKRQQTHCRRASVHPSSRSPLCRFAAPLLPPPRPQWTRCPRRLPLRSLLLSQLRCSQSSPCWPRPLHPHHRLHRLNARCTAVQPPPSHLLPSWSTLGPPPARPPLPPPRPILLSVCSPPGHPQPRSRKERLSSAAVREINAKNSIRPLPVLGSQSRQRQTCSSRRVEANCVNRKCTTRQSRFTARLKRSVWHLARTARRWNRPLR